MTSRSRTSIHAAFPALASLLVAASLGACSSSPSATSPAVTPDGTPTDGGAETGPAAATPGPDTVVTGFDAQVVQFTPQNLREVTTEATFPSEGSYARITLTLTLGCPSGKCDAWDRFGTLGIVVPSETPVDAGGEEKVIELARYMTPYGVGGSWDIDVTDLRPLLKGTLKLRAFIDTWVGQGHAQGNGWLVTTKFTMEGGVPEREPLAVIPLWMRKEAAYGDPAHGLAESLPAQTPALPKGATSYAVRTFVTGHGQGNADNCAEFCPKTHTLTVGGTAFPRKIWRTDCATTTVPKQAGNYKPSRAGWCPGAEVHPWTVDVTEAVAGGAPSFAYDVEAYENTCRPDAPTCAGCVFGTPCEYDGGNHTAPYFAVSSLLIAYR